MIQGLFAFWPILKELLYGSGVIKDPKEEREYQLKLIELAQKDQDFYARQVESINATMQAEAKSERWAQWLWRPLIGFTFAAVIINNYILMPYLQHYLQPIALPDRVWDAMLVILGAAAATRGWQKVEEAKKNGNGVKPVVVPPAPSVRPERP